MSSFGNDQGASLLMESMRQCKNSILTPIFNSKSASVRKSQLPERPSYRKKNLDKRSIALGRKMQTRSVKDRELLQSNMQKLISLDDAEEPQYRTALNPKLIKMQKDQKTDKEKSLHKKHKKRLFWDFLGCGNR